jgi:hypothetical protein
MSSLYDTINLHLAYPSRLGFIGLALFYTALVIAVRWQMIAQPLRNGISARLRLLRADVHRLKDHNDRDSVEARDAVIEIITVAVTENAKRGVLEVLFWSRGQETAIWRLIDKAESYLTYTWKKPKLVIRLASASAQLKQLQDPAASVLAANIDAKLPLAETTSHDELCELHREAVRIQRESLVAGDVESDYFNNKILWHIMVALAAIMFVANIGPTVAAEFLPLPNLAKEPALVTIPSIEALYVVVDSEPLRHAFILFLLGGAVGGILSRLAHVLRLGASPSERSVSWMAMFLSPLVGALTGWSGCLLLLAGHSLKLVLGDVTPTQLWLLLVSSSVLFGFSERAFVGIVEKLENNMLAAPAAAPVVTPTVKPTGQPIGQPA